MLANSWKGLLDEVRTSQVIGSLCVKCREVLVTSAAEAHRKAGEWWSRMPISSGATDGRDLGQ
jgi:hypothetical protein